MKRPARAKYNASSKTSRKEETAAHLGIATAHTTSGPSRGGGSARGKKKRAGCNAIDMDSRTIVATNPFDDDCHSLSQSPAIQQPLGPIPMQQSSQPHHLMQQHHQQQIPQHMQHPHQSHSGPYSPMPHGMQPMQPHMTMHPSQSPYHTAQHMPQYQQVGQMHNRGQYMSGGPLPMQQQTPPPGQQHMTMRHTNPMMASQSGQMMPMNSQHMPHHHAMSTPPLHQPYAADGPVSQAHLSANPSTQRPPQQLSAPNAASHRATPQQQTMYASGPPPSGTPNSGYAQASYSTPSTPGAMAMMDPQQQGQPRQPQHPGQMDPNYVQQQQQQQQQQQHLGIYCAECRLPIYSNETKIMCRAGCESYYHRHCSGLIELACEMLLSENFAEWACNRCVSINRLVPHVRIAQQPDCRQSV